MRGVTKILAVVSVTGLLAINPFLRCDAESFTTNIVNAVSTNAGASLIVGNTGSFNYLEIRNGGSVTNQIGTVGNTSAASNSSVLVTGAGSLWRNTGTLTIGASGSNNRLSVTNAGNITTTNLIISATASATNNLVLIDGGSMSATNITVGELGTGQLILSNGTVLARQIFIGSNAFSVGTMTVAGGTISNSATITVGAHSNATGAIWVKSGLLTMASNSLFVARTGTASMTVSGGTVQVPGIFVGVNGSSRGTLTQSGGTVTLRNSMTVGGVTNASSGAVWITGGQFIATNGTIQVGSVGSGVLTISNTSVLVNNLFVSDTVNLVGATISYRGSVNVSGLGPPLGSSLPGVLWLKDGAFNAATTNTGFNVGIGALGKAIISNSAITAASSIIGFADGNGTLTLAGGSMILTTNLYVGVIGTGTVWVTSGQLTQTNTLTVVGSDGFGTMTVSNGLVDLSDVRLGGSSSTVGTLTIAGGTVRASSGVILGDCPFDSIGLISVEGGALFVTNAPHSATLDVQKGTIMLSSGTLIVDRLVMTNSCGHFVRTGGTLSITSTNLGAGLDADGDGLPNDWEQMFGFNPLSSVGANEANQDPDGDGFTNLQEFQAGTDPTNSASAFRITSITRASTNILVTWTMGGGRTNALQRTAGGVSGSFSTNNFADIFTVTNTAGIVTNYVDLNAATNVPALYYRVRLVP